MSITKTACIPGVRWYQNIQQPDIPFIPLTKTYTPEAYPTYDNYNAIEINKTKNIPKDYIGIMGVPISFLDKYNPRQFEIISRVNAPSINEKKIYKRLIIKHRGNNEYY